MRNYAIICIMKICLISSRFYPQLVGSGTSAFVIASELARRGHNVTVLVDGSMRGEKSHANLPFSVCYVDDLEGFALGKSSFRTPLESIHEFVMQIQPDVLHVCNFMPMFLVSIIRPTIQCPVVFTFFNTPIIGKRTVGYFTDPTLESSLGSFVIKTDAYDGLILGSKHYVDAAILLGADPKKMKLSYLAPDLDSFTKAAVSPGDKNKIFEEYLPGQKFDGRLVLLPSRITKQKGILEAIEALAIINNGTNKYKLLLTGMANPFDSDYAKSVQKKIDELGVREYILVPSRTIDRSNLSIFFKSAELVVVPSWYEGLGLAAIEAQYLGVPLAAADTTGLNEVVNDGENGLLFTPKDSQSMAKAMMSILNKETDVDKLVENAKRTVKKFSLDNHIDKLEDEYERLIKGYKA